MLNLKDKDSIITVVNSIEATLKDNYRRKNNIDEFNNWLEWANEIKFNRLSDNEYFIKLRNIVFYSGFKASYVNRRMETLNKHFPHYCTVSKYGKDEIKKILSDDDMIKNERKINAVVSNAKEIQNIMRENASFFDYLNKFEPEKSIDNLLSLKKDLQFRFDYLGEITVYHFLMDIGLDVLKPDRVITRIFTRLGLLKSEKEYWEAVKVGIEISKIVNKPIRTVDILFVQYGQILDGAESICLKENPQCEICKIKKYCDYK